MQQRFSARRVIAEVPAGKRRLRAASLAVLWLWLGGVAAPAARRAVAASLVAAVPGSAGPHAGGPGVASGEKAAGQAVRSLLLGLAEVPAPTGDEVPLRRRIMEELRLRGGDESLEVDGLGNLRVNTAPLHRDAWLFLLPLDDPTFAVSGRLAGGWLQVVSLARPALTPQFIRHVAGSEVWVMTQQGAVPGLFALPSIHLQGGRPGFPPPATVASLLVDVGAGSRDEVEASDPPVQLLDRVVPRVDPVLLADGSVVGLGVGRRGVAAAVILAAGGGRLLPPLVFVAQSRFAGRGVAGLAALLQQAASSGTRIVVLQAAEKRHGFQILLPPPAEASSGGADEGDSGARALRRELAAAVAAAAPLDVEMPVQVGTAAPGRSSLFRRVPAGQGLILEYPVDDLDRLAETIHPAVVRVLSHLLGSLGPAATSEGRASHRSAPVLSSQAVWRRPVRLSPVDPTQPFSHMPGLMKAAGVSGRERPVAEVVRRQMPRTMREHLQQDTEGNLLLTLGRGQPHLLFVAHLDETGYRVAGIDPDGGLQVEKKGGFYDSAVLDRPVRVHLSGGDSLPGVLRLAASGAGSAGSTEISPPGVQESAAQGTPVPLVGRLPAASLRVYLGSHSAAETAALGVDTGDTVTVPKHFRLMGAHRGVGRSVDDRAGCAALLAAVHRLALSGAAGKGSRRDPLLPAGFLARDGHLPRGQVTFAWVVREEIGLEGSGVLAKRLTPDEVYAVDTFVSSDSPLERDFFALARLGDGAVLRAVDSSNLSPLPMVRQVFASAQAAGIPVQLGAGRGGNDGSVFTTGQVFDLPLAWPGRYSHSAVEMIDARDHRALVDLILHILVQATGPGSAASNRSGPGS